MKRKASTLYQSHKELPCPWSWTEAWLERRTQAQWVEHCSLPQRYTLDRKLEYFPTLQKKTRQKQQPVVVVTVVGKLQYSYPL